jgi:hypothetical protein
MLPAVFAAAEQVELARLDPRTVALAIETWRIWDARPAAEVAATLLTWWQVYCDSRPPWPIALAALDRMFEPSAGEHSTSAAALSAAQ